MHPFTEAEKQSSPGAFLETLLKGGLQPEIQSSSTTSSDLATRIIQGGCPEVFTRTEKRSNQWQKQYLKSIIERDVQDISNITDATQLHKIIEILAQRTGELLNVSNLSKELQMSRQTVESYLSILEKLFLTRKLPAWHKNGVKRLIKTPKIHVRDTGLSTTLAKLSSDQWIYKKDAFGHHLESWAVQQLIAQADTLDDDIHFHHYRDKDMVEVDLVITHNHKVWGIEVKASATLSDKDGKGLRRLAANAGDSYAGGILLYDGESTLTLNEERNELAVPFSKIWEL